MRTSMSRHWTSPHGCRSSGRSRQCSTLAGELGPLVGELLGRGHTRCSPDHRRVSRGWTHDQYCSIGRSQCPRPRHCGWMVPGHRRTRRGWSTSLVSGPGSLSCISRATQPHSPGCTWRSGDRSARGGGRCGGKLSHSRRHVSLWRLPRLRCQHHGPGARSDSPAGKRNELYCYLTHTMADCRAENNGVDWRDVVEGLLLGTGSFAWWVWKLFHLLPN